jgi:molybdate transport system ATP-binding protein
MSAAPQIDARLIKRFAAAPGSPPFELNIHLQAASGVTALLGTSGAGKTLTLNCLAGFVRPDEGRILVMDELFCDVARKVHLAPERRRCGYIFQEEALFPHMTLSENLRFAVDAARARSKVLRRRYAQELLEGFELAELGGRRPHELSGGQRQRAVIARALAAEPRLLLLDEPARGLDYRLRQSFYEILRRAKERLAAPIVMVTHDAEECFELADFVYLMDAGRCLQSGPLEHVFNRPASLDLARSLGLFSLLPCQIVTLDPGRNVSRLRALEQELEGPYLPAHLKGDRGWLCVRRSELRIVAPNDRSARNILRMRPQRVGKSTRGVRIEFADQFAVELGQSEYAEWRGSRELTVLVPPGTISFLSK